MQNAKHTVAFVAIGSNLGDSRGLLERAFVRLQELSITPIRRSSLWRSAPMGCPPGSPDFLNAVAALFPRPDETPESLLAKLRALEISFGRQPKVILNEPRPLDLDLIAFGDEMRTSAQLTLPHPRAHLRGFVLAPLAELAPNWVLEGQGESVVDLLRRIPVVELPQRVAQGTGNSSV
jgi:2-amino-4-hydroxy-6-hydroxymethyldihydropteridine diphosphokinase